MDGKCMILFHCHPQMYGGEMLGIPNNFAFKWKKRFMICCFVDTPLCMAQFRMRDKCALASMQLIDVV